MTPSSLESSEKKVYIRPKNRKMRGTSNSEGSESSILSFVPPSRPECSSPLDRFCSVLTAWDLGENISDIGSLTKIQEVPLQFPNYSKYVKIWEPLLTKEIQANLLSSLSKSPNYGLCQLHHADTDDSRSQLLKVQCLLDNIDKSTSMQVLVIAALPIQQIQSMVVKREVPVGTKYMIGVITGQHRQNYEVMIRRDNYMAVVSSRSLKSQDFTYLELGSVTSQFREFLALHEAHRMPILPSILRPSTGACSRSVSLPPTPPQSPLVYMLEPSSEVALGECDTGEDDPATPSEQKQSVQWSMPGVGDAFNKYLHSKFNSSQLHAIRAAVETKKGFCLIQGPPGTGKTSTILGLLNSVHIRDYNTYFETILANALGPEGLRCRERGEDPVPWVALINSLVSSSARPHLLVVAPSNVAVNNIIQRIAEKGFKDSSGSTYFPNILRVGSGGSKGEASARAVSLEESVETMLHENVDNCEVQDRELAVAVKAVVNSIIQLQTVLLNMKICWDSHPLGPGWELRIIMESGQPYWVDHRNKKTSSTPPPPTKLLSDYTLQTLPEYKYYTLLIVQKLEELRILHLRKARVRVVKEFYHNQSRGRGLSSLRHSLESSFIDEADIVFTTLNSSGHPCLEGSVFPVVIIDEAAQCVEPSTLIPLRLGCVQCVMVGDQKQLSATIFSKTLSSKFFDRSLFERLDRARMQDSSSGSIMLDTQYRMLPEISRFPSIKFYNDLLKDGENVKIPGYGPAFLGAPQEVSYYVQTKEKFPLKPFIFFDLLSSQDALASSAVSRSNVEEARLCLQLVELIIGEANRSKSSVGSIGIITPYQEQLRDLTRLFENASLIAPRGRSTSARRDTVPTISWKDGEEGEHSEGFNDAQPNADDLYEGLFGSQPETSGRFHDIELNTVDAFQGREKDIIVISCVRANDIGSIGFLSDTRRMNVALTRARFGLYVIGNATTLRCNKDWGDLISHAESRNCLVSIESSNVDIFSRMEQGSFDNTVCGVGSRKRAFYGGCGFGEKEEAGGFVDVVKISRTESEEDGEVVEEC